MSFSNLLKSIKNKIMSDVEIVSKNNKTMDFTINQKKFTGSNITIKTIVEIDGVEVDDSIISSLNLNKKIEIEINSDCERVFSANGNIKITSATEVKTTNGNVSVMGSIQNVRTTNGDVSASVISGKIETVNGDIKKGKWNDFSF